MREAGICGKKTETWTASGRERRSVIRHVQRAFDVGQEKINIRARRREVGGWFVAGGGWRFVWSIEEKGQHNQKEKSVFEGGK
jgi:hypothetical protein